MLSAHVKFIDEDPRLQPLVCIIKDLKEQIEKTILNNPIFEKKRKTTNDADKPEKKRKKSKKSETLFTFFNKSQSSPAKVVPTVELTKVNCEAVAVSTQTETTGDIWKDLDGTKKELEDSRKNEQETKNKLAIAEQKLSEYFFKNLYG